MNKVVLSGHAWLRCVVRAQKHFLAYGYAKAIWIE